MLTRRGLLAGAPCGAAACDRTAERSIAPLSALDRIRRDFRIPAMAALVVGANQILRMESAGVLREGRPDAVNPSSQFHLGSLAKAMTATMVATLVEEGKRGWGSTIPDVFPEWKESIHPAYRGVSMDDLFRLNLGAYGRFLQLHLGGLQGRDSLLRSETGRHLHTPLDGCGLGWGVGPVNGLLCSDHVGGAGSFLAVVTIHDTRGVAVAVAANLDRDKALGACCAASRAMWSRRA
jgi:CubicO group peptidase (beta-lactamase class C family)